MPIISDYRLEELIIIGELQKIENYLGEVKWGCANQTVKILSRVFYEQTNTLKQYEWEEIPENGLDKMPTKRDFKQLEEAIVDISLYLAAFGYASEEEKVNDLEYPQQIADVLLDECALRELNPILDKALAYAVIILLKTADNLQNEESNVEKISKNICAVFDILNRFAVEHSEKSELSSAEMIVFGAIDTSTLEIGQVVKNYKELCVLLKQDIKNGKSKKLQIEEFKRYFDFEKSGQKFIITDIYDEPLTKEDKRKLGNNSIYVKYIELILLNHLSKQEGYTRTLTKRNWWELLGMVNKKYNKIAPKQLERIDYTITPFQINHFYQRCNKKLEQILFSALNNLKNRKLIIWELQTVVVTIDDKGKERYFLALDEHKKKILQVERHILTNVMNYEKMFQVFCNNKQSEYYRLVNEKLNELYGWHHYFKQIKLIYTPEDVLEAVKQSEVDLQKEILNQKIVSVLNDNAKEKYDKEMQRCKETRNNLLIWGDYEESGQHRKWLPDTYIEAQRILTEELINIGHKENRFMLEHFEEDDELNQIFNSFMC